jgi:hypothetical protein
MSSVAGRHECPKGVLSKGRVLSDLTENGKNHVAAARVKEVSIIAVDKTKVTARPVLQEVNDAGRKIEKPVSKCIQRS